MNVADFQVVGYDETWINCPMCGKVVTESPNGFTIRDLIAAASDHARGAHPVSVGTPV